MDEFSQFAGRPFEVVDVATPEVLVGGLFGGELLDEKGVTAVSKLPTKQELMATTATLLTVLPAKLARTLKNADATRIARGVKEAQGSKLARAVKAMGEKLPEA